MFCGLQGSGKTTSIAKLSYLLKKSSKKKILLASADIYRPAAQEQLKVLAEETGSDFFNHNLSSASKIVDDSIDYAQKNLFDILILDTAGRQVVYKKLMSELIEIENEPGEEAFPVETYPTFMVRVNDKMVDTIQGYSGKNQIETKLNSY